MGERIGRREVLKGTGMAIAAVSLGALASPSADADAASDAQTPDAGVDLLERAVLSTNDGGYVDEPVLASNGNGGVWVVWLRRGGSDREVLMVSERTGEWSPARPVVDAEGMYESPRIACAPGGLPMLVWVEISQGSWSLNSSGYADGRFGQPSALSSGISRVWSPALIAEKQPFSCA